MILDVSTRDESWRLSDGYSSEAKYEGSHAGMTVLELIHELQDVWEYPIHKVVISKEPRVTTYLSLDED